MKCKNCGADVAGIKCEYCGTVYAKQVALTFRQLAIDPGRCADGTIPRPIIKDTIEITALGDNGVRRFYEV